MREERIETEMRVVGGEWKGRKGGRIESKEIRKESGQNRERVEK